MLLVLLLVPLLLAAEGEPAARHHLVADTWSVKQGLPFDPVRSVLQSNDGYLLLGARNQLVRFDGVRFTPYRFQINSEHEITAVAEDRNGAVWVGTAGNGLHRVDNSGVGQRVNSPEVPAGHITALDLDRKGRLWIGSRSGLACLDGEKWKVLSSGRTRRDSIRTFAPAADGRMWVGTWGAGVWLASCDSGEIRPTPLDSALVLDLLESREGVLWYALEGGETGALRGDKFVARAFTGPGERAVSAFAEDADGALWAGTLGGSLLRWEGTGFELASRFVGTSVLALIADREGSLWAGTYGGLVRYKRPRFTSFGPKEGFPSNYARSIFEDGRGRIWIATDGAGLTCLSGGRWLQYGHAQGLANLHIKGIGETPGGQIWAATHNRVLRLEGKRFVEVKAIRTNGQIRVFHIDRSGSLWISTSDTPLTRYSGSKPVALPPGAEEIAARLVYEDRKGGLWVATIRELKHITEGRTATYAIPDPHPSTGVRTILEDSAGVIWAAGPAGLMRLENGRLKTLPPLAGFPATSVFELQEDAQGRLWAATSRGIYSLSRTELENYGHGGAAPRSDWFDMADGLPTNDFGILGPGSLRTREGLLWFTCNRGVVCTDPRKVKRNELPPAVRVESVLADGVPVSGLIPAGVRALEVHYTATSLVAPERVRFRYKLETYDQDWIEAGARRTAFYTNLRPGQYRFRVTASNNDGVWSEAGAQVPVEVAAYFHQTKLFYVFSAMLAILVGWTVHQIRIRQVRARYAAIANERNRIARDLHDSVEQKLVAIACQLKAAERWLPDIPGKAKTHFDTARELVRHTQTELKSSVWDLRPVVLEQGSVRDALGEIVRQLTEGTGLRASLEVSGEPRPVPAVVASGLLRIGQEAVTNAVKHSGARTLRVQLTWQAGQVRLRVEDDGCGCDLSRLSLEGAAAFGLMGMKERAERLGGHVVFRGANGQGTEVSVEIPA